MYCLPESKMDMAYIFASNSPPLFCHPEEFQLGITEMKRGDIVEIDDLEELAAIDCNYQKYLKEVE